MNRLETQNIYEIFRACRLCGAGGGYKMPIIQNVVDLDDSEIGLKQKIKECVKIEVDAQDKMPPLICELCIDKVNDFYEFQVMCQQTNKQTRLRLGLPLQAAPNGGAEQENCILGVTEPVYVNDSEDEPLLRRVSKHKSHKGKRPELGKQLVVKLDQTLQATGASPPTSEAPARPKPASRKLRERTPSPPRGRDAKQLARKTTQQPRVPSPSPPRSKQSKQRKDRARSRTRSRQPSPPRTQPRAPARSRTKSPSPPQPVRVTRQMQEEDKPSRSTKSDSSSSSRMKVTILTKAQKGLLKKTPWPYHEQETEEDMAEGPLHPSAKRRNAEKESRAVPVPIKKIKIAAPPTQKPIPPAQRPAPPGHKQAPPGHKPAPPGQKPSPPGQKPSPSGQKPSPPGQKPTLPGQKPSPLSQKPAPPAPKPSPPKPPPIECKVCRTQLKSPAALSNHQRSHHASFTNPKLACNACAEWFNSPDETQAHHKAHRAALVPYRCTNCGDTFTTYTGFNEHHEGNACDRYIELPDEKCNECLYIFPTWSLKDRHRCQGVDGRPGGKCSKCRRSYALWKNLTKHESTCTAKRRGQLIIDPEVMRELRPAQIVVQRCDALLTRYRRGHVDAAGVSPKFGLDPNRRYPYFETGLRVKRDPDGMVNITDELLDSTSFWNDSSDGDCGDDTASTDSARSKSVKSLAALSLKTIFSKKFLGELPKSRRKKIKKEKVKIEATDAFDSMMNAEVDNDFSKDIDNIICNLDMAWDDCDPDMADKSILSGILNVSLPSVPKDKISEGNTKDGDTEKSEEITDSTNGNKDDVAKIAIRKPTEVNKENAETVEDVDGNDKATINSKDFMNQTENEVGASGDVNENGIPDDAKSQNHLPSEGNDGGDLKDSTRIKEDVPNHVNTDKDTDKDSVKILKKDGIKEADTKDLSISSKSGHDDLDNKLHLKEGDSLSGNSNDADDTNHSKDKIHNNYVESQTFTENFGDENTPHLIISDVKSQTDDSLNAHPNNIGPSPTKESHSRSDDFSMENILKRNNDEAHKKAEDKTSSAQSNTGHSNHTATEVEDRQLMDDLDAQIGETEDLINGKSVNSHCDSVNKVSTQEHSAIKESEQEHSAIKDTAMDLDNISDDDFNVDS